jgi:hypothetical protein
MVFAKLTTGELEFLSDGGFPIEGKLADEHIGLNPPGFKTIDACRTEDRNRDRALRALAETRWSGTRRKAARSQKCGALLGDPLELATLLETIADPTLPPPIRGCMASALYMRHRRIGVLGAIYQLVRASGT